MIEVQTMLAPQVADHPNQQETLGQVTIMIKVLDMLLQYVYGW